ncbi:MAG: hypothetical protein P4L40_06745 [Terracidiphilus sp.]|nr:hypothetical protein [Terracidiphilus sp.]
MFVCLPFAFAYVEMFAVCLPFFSSADYPSVCQAPRDSRVPSITATEVEASPPRVSFATSAVASQEEEEGATYAESLDAFVTRLNKDDVVIGADYPEIVCASGLLIKLLLPPIESVESDTESTDDGVSSSEHELPIQRLSDATVRAVLCL